MEEMDVSQLAEERPPAGPETEQSDALLPEAQLPDATDDAQLKAVLEAIVYITDEPLSAQQMAAALGHPIDQIKRLLDELVAEYAQRPEHGTQRA